MSAAAGKQSQLHKTNPTAGGFSVGKQASILLEKGNPGLRRATPDSEALASSDDETDHGMSSSMISNPPANRPRRTSWLAEIPSTKRKPSITFGTPISPTSSHPATPPADTGAWLPASAQNAPSSGGRSHQGQASYAWGSTIWNEPKKEAPSRLQEVLQSPTATTQAAASFLSDEFASPPGSRGNLGEATIPFSIPLHPTPKTYRSQSYSVGQMEQENGGTHLPAAGGSRTFGRGRAGPQYPTLQQRSSRPGVLGDFGHDSGVLGRVSEDDNDEEEEDEPHALHFSSGEPLPWDARKMHPGQSYKENAPLRNADNSFRSRTLSMASATNYVGNGSLPRGSFLYGTGLGEADQVVDDPEDVGDLSVLGQHQPYARRYSEQYSDAGRLSTRSQTDSRNLESVRKAHWQTSLGFGSIPELPQSRRHSFADIPTRHGSISSVNDGQASLLGLGTRLPMEDLSDPNTYYAEDTHTSSRGENRESSISFNPNACEFHPAAVEEQRIELEHLRQRDFAAAYFSGEASFRANSRSLQQPYGAPNTYGRGHHSALSRHDQPLFVVTFKAQRADVFYIQEDTGLEVKNGDLVIVEADRGTDLGTVAAANVSWEDARAIKAQLSEEHYKWLMLFSRQGQATAATTNGVGNITGSAVGGMGPPGTHGLQEPQSGDLKPKLIKRLAQNHEIQTLRDKEGNEAKAKRVCQQKVVEHRLNMEILDAEFQMDWKKLTFYYFADSYINFNSLVTDLFKIYKTRIWMSAINPDSFITPPSAGVSFPSPIGAGPGNGGAGPENPTERHRPFGHAEQQSPTGFGNDVNDPTRNPLVAHGVAPRSFGSSPYSSMPIGYQANLRSSMFPQQLHQQPDPFSSYLGSSYGALDPLSGYPMTGAANNRPSRGMQSPGEDWTGNFQGLSLGS